MSDFQYNNSRVKFSAPDRNSNIVTVTRLLSDGTEEKIGEIYPDFQVGDGPQYYSISLGSNETFIPTTDFIEIEKEFEKEAQRLDDLAYISDLESLAEIYEDRSVSINAIRSRKTSTRSKIPTR